MINKILLFCIAILIYNKSFADLNTDKIINYLDKFSTLKSNFIQINNNGDILTGSILLLRPGKFRVEYNEIPLLIMSDGKKVAVINKEIKNISFYGLSDLPANILLFKDISLKNINLKETKTIENRIEISFVVNEKKSNDVIRITFEKKPFEMKKWSILRPDNSKTEIVFNNLFFDNVLNPSLFDIDYEDPRLAPWKN